MNTNDIPYLIESSTLASRLSDANLLIVDLGSSENYLGGHVPGAIHLDYNGLILGQPPAPGLLPPLERLQQTLQSIGLTPNKHVIAYDDQGNTRASRLLWTLEAIGHQHASLLNGGLAAWHNDGHMTEQTPNQADVVPDTPIKLNPAVIAEQADVLAALGDERVIILDARTPEEYNGDVSASTRAGHIPGARNLNWLDTIDRDNNLRYKSENKLNAMLAQLGIVDRKKEIIVYCQTHHRSAHSFVMLRHLGFENVRAYPGSWSQWGNDPDTPIE